MDLWPINYDVVRLANWIENNQRTEEFFERYGVDTWDHQERLLAGVSVLKSEQARLDKEHADRVAENRRKAS